MSSIFKKVFMALTGIGLSLFILVHVVGNSTTFFGKEVFNTYAHHLHSLGVLIPIFECGLLALFLLHVFLGIVLFFENQKARPQDYHAMENAGGRTLGSRTMPYTGAFIFLFIIVHLKDFHFIDQGAPISEVVRESLEQPVMAAFYIFSLVALTLHVSHGFWSVFQSLGLNHPRYNRLLQNGAICLALVTGIAFICIPILAIISKNFLT